MHLIGAALGDHADVAAQRAAQLGLAAGRDDLEFLHYVEPEEGAAEARRIVVGGKSVDHEVIREIALAAHRDALSRYRRSLREQLVAAGVSGRHTRHQEREIQETTPVERQSTNFALRHRAGHLGARRLEQIAFAGDHHVGLRGGHRQHHGKLIGRADTERDGSHGGGEAGLLYADFIRADLEGREAESALEVCQGRARDIGIDLARGDLRVRYHGTGSVGHTPAHARELNGFLRRGGN